MKPPKSRSGKGFKRTYYLSEHMSFLLPYVKGKPTVKVENSSVNDSRANIDKDEEANSSEETPKEPEPEPEPSCTVQTMEPPAPRIEKIDFQDDRCMNEANPAHEWIKMKKDITRKQLDSDELFLLSLLPDIRKLSAQRKRYFKLETMSLLNKFADEDESYAQGSNVSLTN
nr:uncharacterized protein LOC106691037 [Halyomorpha halys]